VLQSMRMPDGTHMWEGYVLSAAIIANLFVTFPAQMLYVYRAAEQRACGRYSPTVRFALLFITLLIGLFVPYFLQFFGLLASLLGVFFVFGPLALYWGLAMKTGLEVSRATVLKHAVVMSLGSIALVFGTWTSLLDLIAKFTGAQ